MKVEIDYSKLTGSLTMSKLLSLEPLGLRKLLKAGLRRGSTEEEMGVLVSTHLFSSPSSDESIQLFGHLQEIGWISLVQGRWKTHFRVP